MPNYELIYIVSPDVANDDLNNVVNKVGEFVKKVDGNVTEVNQWGRKKLTYPIRKFSEGNYVLAHLEMEPQSIKSLDADLQFDSEILRHLIVRS